jgi:hypothetical protein
MELRCNGRKTTTLESKGWCPDTGYHSLAVKGEGGWQHLLCKVIIRIENTQ